MVKVYIQGPGCKPEYCDLDRVPAVGELLELGDRNFAQVVAVTHTPHRLRLDAVLEVGALEDDSRKRAVGTHVATAVQGLG